MPPENREPGNLPSAGTGTIDSGARHRIHGSKASQNHEDLIVPSLPREDRAHFPCEDGLMLYARDSKSSPPATYRQGDFFIGLYPRQADTKPYWPSPAGACPPQAGFCPLSLSGQFGLMAGARKLWKVSPKASIGRSELTVSARKLRKVSPKASIGHFELMADARKLRI